MNRTSVVFLLAAGTAIVTIACLSTGAAARPAKEKPAEDRQMTRPVNPEELAIVDCLLPGQVRSLGRSSTFLTARRPIRTTGLDCKIRGGEQVVSDRANYQEALKVWIAAAETGDVEAQYYVGEIYEKGLGTEPDYARAAEWYRKAADRGYGPAQTNLGFLYEKGLGVERDPRMAVELYRKAMGVAGTIILEDELAAWRQDVEEKTARLEKATESIRQLRDELEATRSLLNEQQDTAQHSVERETELKQKLASLTDTLRSREREIGELQTAQKRYNMPGPTIRVLNTTTFRSAPQPQPPAISELVGRVEAPAGLASFTVNGNKSPVEPDGFFRIDVKGESRFDLVAIDNQGKRGELVHLMSGTAPSPKPTTAMNPAQFGAYHALVIGNANYDAFPDLQTASADAKAIADLLKNRYGFQTQLLVDAKQTDILLAFYDLQKLTPSDNLLIYFAGHGELDRTSGMGYWLPVDARADSEKNWISANDIGNHLSLLEAKHVLVVADSCYSALLPASTLPRFEGVSPKEKSRWIQQVREKKSRIGLTSGGVKPVLDAGDGDHSIFARALMEVLGRNSEVLDTRSLWSEVKNLVEFQTKRLNLRQTPEWAPIRNAGHESGEFFFVPQPGAAAAAVRRPETRS